MRSLSIILIALLACLLSACAGSAPTPSFEPTEATDPVVVRINGVEYRQSLLDQDLAFDRAVHFVTTGRELTRQDPQLKLERMTTGLLIDQQARAAGITATEAEIEAALSAFINERNTSF